MSISSDYPILDGSENSYQQQNRKQKQEQEQRQGQGQEQEQEQEHQWQIVGKNRKKVQIGDKGDKIKLPFKYVVWYHSIRDRDWTIHGYKKMMTLETVSDFWQFFNSFDKTSYKFYHFYIMKEGIDPTWEHKANAYGGICSFKVDILSAPQMWEYVNCHIMVKTLIENMEDINGSSCSPKKDWAIIKIWNRNSKNDLSKSLCKEVKTFLPNLSIQYKANAPEY